MDEGSAYQPNIPPKDNEYNIQVWKVLKEIENESIVIDIAQGQFNKLFKIHQKDILTLANINK